MTSPWICLRVAIGHLVAPMDFSKAARFFGRARLPAARVLKPWTSQWTLARLSTWTTCGFLAGDFLAVGTISIVAMRFATAARWPSAEWKRAMDGFSHAYRRGLTQTKSNSGPMT